MPFNSPIHNDLIALRASYEDAARAGRFDTAGSLRDADRLLSALESGHFTFASEPWHNVAAAMMGTSGNTQYELLLRPYDSAGGFAPFAGVNALNAAGLNVSLDRVLVSAALGFASHEHPRDNVAINIAAETTRSAEFWQWVARDVRAIHPQIDPRKITFEITEDSVAEGALIGALRDIKKQGYHFAIDDFTSSAFDNIRLRNLAEVSDYVKVSGAVIEAGIKQPSRLKDVLRSIRNVVPNAVTVAEWVKTPAMSLQLKEIGFDLMQGRELPKTPAEFIIGIQAALGVPAIAKPAPARTAKPE